MARGPCAAAAWQVIALTNRGGDRKTAPPAARWQRVHVMLGRRASADESCRPGVNGAMPDKVIFIAGTGHMGSTLLSFLLNAHPQMVSVGEETGPVRSTGPMGPAERRAYRCSCGTPLADCQFWRRVESEMYARGIVFGPDRWDIRYELGYSGVLRHLLCRSLRLRALDHLRDGVLAAIPRFASRIAELNARNATLIRVILEITGKQVFVSAAKDPIRARYLNRIPELDVRVVHLVGDSLRFVSSEMTRRKMASPTIPIRQWKRTAKHVKRLIPDFPPDRFIRVRYEDLCTDTEGQLARIAEFAGLAPVSGPIRFREADHHIIGNRMRSTGSDEIVLDEKWRTALSPGVAQRIRDATRTYREEFGYS